MSEARLPKFTSEQITIRHAEPTDAADLQSLMAGRAAYSGTMQLPYVQEKTWAERLAKTEQNAMILVAVLNGQVVGHSGLHLETKLRRRHAAHLGISVRGELAGRGIGDLLLSAVLDVADNWANVLRVELTVFVDNLAARKMYEKHGFVQEGLLRGYALRDGCFVDVVTMARFHPKRPELQQSLEVK